MRSDPPMDSARRHWMLAAGVAALAASTPACLLAGPGINPVVPPGNGLDLLDLRQAESMLGQQFEIAGTRGHAICLLTRVEVYRTRNGERLQAFSMDFSPVSVTGTLAQDTYLVHHPVLGNFEMLLVPHAASRGEVLVATLARL